MVLPQPTLSGLPPPHPALEACVVIPAKDEEALLPHALAALAGQCDLEGRPLGPDRYEVIVLANNCTDATAEVARQVGQAHDLRLWVAECLFAPGEASVGRARRLLMNTACYRLIATGRLGGAILSTDADSEVAPDWVAATLAELGDGVDGVGGRILLRDRAALDARIRRSVLLDVGYHRWVQELHTLLDPDAHDPFPRHHQHLGASLAVTAAAYARCGGMPLVTHAEDVALFDAVEAVGGRFRHSPRVQVYTSARRGGRAPHGLSAALGAWTAEVQERGTHTFRVEAAAVTERRLALRGRVRRLWHAQPHPDPDEAASLARELGLSARALLGTLAGAPTATAAAALTEDQRRRHDAVLPPEPIEQATRTLRERVGVLRVYSAVPPLALCP